MTSAEDDPLWARITVTLFPGDDPVGEPCEVTWRYDDAKGCWLPERADAVDPLRQVRG